MLPGSSPVDVLSRESPIKGLLSRTPAAASSEGDADSSSVIFCAFIEQCLVVGAAGKEGMADFCVFLVPDLDENACGIESVERDDALWSHRMGSEAIPAFS